MTKGTATNLSVGLHYRSATSVGNYALIAGGNDSDVISEGTTSSVVDTYNPSLTKGTTNLSVARQGTSATSVGNYALIAGGITDWSSSTYYGTLTTDAFSQSLTRTTAPDLLSRTRSGAATTVGEYALFVGGYESKIQSKIGSSRTAYDICLTVSDQGGDLTSSVKCGGHVGNYAVFITGYGYYIKYKYTV